MYERFYRLHERPFSLLPDPAFLYPSKQHQMALTVLEYSLLNQTGFCVLSGGIGAGKTTLIRYLLAQFGDDVAVGLVSNTHRAFGELLQWVLVAFGIESTGNDKAAMHAAFVNFLIAQYAKRRRTLLIIDEAQNLCAQTLEELRMLSNINADKDQVLQVFLVGQPGLRDLLRQPELEQFAQRVGAEYHLESLAPQEVASYICHRLTTAGGDGDLFTPDAVGAIAHYSRGVPRLINSLCDLTLVYGYAEQRPRIDAALVHDAVRDKGASAIVPLARPGNTATRAVGS